jgi:RNA polymerase sigma factor (sigma-70 family)
MHGVTHDSDREFEDLFRTVVAHATTVAEIHGAGDDAADVGQRVGVEFWNAWKQRPGAFRGGLHAMRGWIEIATRRNILDVREADASRTARERDAGGDVHPPARTWMQPHDTLEAGELQRVIAEALARMPRVRRDTWLCVREQGESYDALAKRRGISRNAVKQILLAANADLRAAIAPHLEARRAREPEPVANPDQRREAK